jgi:hypothetical protein
LDALPPSLLDPQAAMDKTIAPLNAIAISFFNFMLKFPPLILHFMCLAYHALIIGGNLKGKNDSIFKKVSFF